MKSSATARVGRLPFIQGVRGAWWEGVSYGMQEDPRLGPVPATATPDILSDLLFGALAMLWAPAVLAR